MKPTGASASTFLVIALRPMRCCSRLNGATRPSFQTTISPSRTVPFGSALASATISGKRSLTSSSPRDQIQTRPARLTTWARMPSYFHSTIQSVGRGELAGEVAFRQVELMGEEERIRLADVERADVARRGELRVALGARRRAAVGVAHHALGDELGIDAGAFGERALHEQLAHADAKAAADQLVEKKAPDVSSSSQYEATRAACSSGSRPRSGRSRSSTHSARPTSLVRSAGGSTCATVSAKSPTPGSRRRRASRRCRRGGMRPPTARRSERPGAACRRRGSSTAHAASRGAAAAK
jgi:hypothetical protein